MNHATVTLAALLAYLLSWSAAAWLLFGGEADTSSRCLYELAQRWPITTALVLIPLHRLSDLILPETDWWRRDLVCFAWLLAGHVFWSWR